MPERSRTQEVAQWAVSLKYDAIPQRVVREAKCQVFSVLAAVLAGARTETGRRILATCKAAGGGAYPLLTTTDTADLADALTAATALSLSLDYDDYLISGHTGHSAVLVPLLMAQGMEITGADFITAQTAANEIGARLGTSVSIGPLNGQMWAFLHAAEAAVITGRFLGLNEKQMASALGIALSRPAFGVTDGFMGGDGKMLFASGPAWDGVQAARFAANGLRGPTAILESPTGFCATFSYVPLLGVFDGLGNCWLSDTLSYKMYPGCAYIDGPMDALFSLLESQPLEASDIKRVRVHGSLLTLRMDEMARPFVRHEVSLPGTLNFYVPYNIAVGILDGRLTAEQFAPRRIADPAVWKLASHVRVVHDLKWTRAFLESLSDLMDARQVLAGLTPAAANTLLRKMFPATPFVVLGHLGEISSAVRDGFGFFRELAGRKEHREGGGVLAYSAEGFRMAIGARVQIELKNGRTLEAEAAVPRGAAGWSIEETEADVAHKFTREAKKTLPPEARERVRSIVSRLETATHADLLTLLDALCAA